MSIRSWFYLALLMALPAAPAAAATLNVVGGELIGATGVDVGGTLYDVTFVDGSCVALFTGCDEGSDFEFQTDAAAALASQALLDQVFLDGGSGSFDTDPELTAGCSNSTLCIALTPYSFPIAGEVGYRSAWNGNGLVFVDELGSPASTFVTYDLAAASGSVYASWSVTPVPEPSTALLLASGLVGLAARGQRKRA